MQSTQGTYEGAGQTPIFIREFVPDGEPVGVIQLLHGMGEHSARYIPLCEKLTEAGFAVSAPDHRGHGETGKAHAADGSGMLTHYADEDGWSKVVEDQILLLGRLRARHPGRPVVLLGHSMGSYIGRALAIRAGHQLDGLVLSGSMGNAPLFFKVTRAIASFEAWRLGPRSPSPLIQRLSFDSFARSIPDRGTEFDWLSRDPAEVQAYIDDPLCGFACTTSLWRDMLGGLVQINTVAQVASMPPDLPIYIMSGEHDPVHEKLKGIRAMEKLFSQAGMQQVTSRVFPDGRHEMFNETNRDEVIEALLAWLAPRVERS